jgi:hypothetical protein
MKFKFWNDSPLSMPTDEKISKIIEILFPPLKTEKIHSPDGQTVTFLIDYSIDCNLEAALMDLQDGTNDEVSQGTIQNTIKRLNAVRDLLEINQPIDDKAEYVTVQPLEVKCH